MPSNPKDYVHRVGRTARAGLCGRAVTLVGEGDVARVLAIEERAGEKMREFEVDEGTVLKRLHEVSVARREVEVRLSEAGFGDKQRTNREKRKLVEEAAMEQEQEETSC